MTPEAISRFVPLRPQAFVVFGYTLNLVGAACQALSEQSRRLEGDRRVVGAITAEQPVRRRMPRLPSPIQR
jgi:hypothetical protein